MELTEYPKGRRLVGYQEIDIEESERLRIQTGTSGNITDQLYEQCPDGKKWTIKITVRIDESDA